MLENELHQQQSQSNHSKWLENTATRRSRLPPPGFSHMNSFGLGVPRPAAQSSKILPFMNGGGSTQTQSPQANWAAHQQQSNMNFAPHDQTGNLMSQQNHQSNKGGKYRSIEKHKNISSLCHHIKVNGFTLK